PPTWRLAIRIAKPCTSRRASTTTAFGSRLPVRFPPPGIEMNWPAAWFVAVLLPGFAVAADREFVPVTDAMLQQPATADWPSFRRTTDGSGFSPLTEVNRENVRQLALVWARPITEGIQ